jgi:hypothetical protein
VFYFYLGLCKIWRRKRKEEEGGEGGAKKIKALLRQK